MTIVLCFKGVCKPKYAIMNNLTLADKQNLESLIASGSQVATIAYNPLTTDSSSETAALADGWIELYRESTPTLIEVIYGKSLPVLIEWERLTSSDDVRITDDGSLRVCVLYGVPPSNFDAPGPGALSFPAARLSSCDVTFPPSNDWAVGTGDFTIEWYQHQVASSATWPRVFSIGDYDSLNISLAASIELGTFYFWVNGSPLLSFAAPAAGEWHHVAIVRRSGTLTAWVDGKLKATAMSNADITQNALPLRLGNEVDSGNPASSSTAFNGRLANFRWINGTAVYTSQFSNPGSLTAVPGTVLLLLASTNVTFLDDTTGSHTIALNNNVEWSSAP